MSSSLTQTVTFHVNGMFILPISKCVYAEVTVKNITYKNLGLNLVKVRM